MAEPGVKEGFGLLMMEAAVAITLIYFFGCDVGGGAWAVINLFVIGWAFLMAKP